jgi:hypothetical protein
MEVYSGEESLTSEEREELRDTLLEDRGPAYVPWMVKEFGPHAGLFMSQLLFWDGKGHDPNGWIYKTEKEMEQETGLTRSSQRKARKILVGKGVLEEDKRGLPRRLHYRADLRALMAILNGEVSTGQKAHHVSEEGSSRLTGEATTTFLTREETTTSPTSEESTKFPASEEGSTDPTYTENTSESTAESLQREESGEPTLQGGANQEFAPLHQEKEEENEGVEQVFGDSSGRFLEPTPISEVARKKSQTEQPKRANPFEINRILGMLTDERYPTCGVYRHFEEGRLSDERLLEAVSHELTGSFIEGERYKEAVEGCVRMLKEEEGIA